MFWPIVRSFMRNIVSYKETDANKENAAGGGAPAPPAVGAWGEGMCLCPRMCQVAPMCSGKSSAEASRKSPSG